MADKVINLGYKINKNSVTPVKEKIENIRTPKNPHTVSELKSFLGLINDYHLYFKNFSETLEPLQELLRKGVKWKWGQKQRTAFEKSKSLIHETNILVHYDPNKPLPLACDASPSDLEAVFLHVMPDGTENSVFKKKLFTNREISSHHKYTHKKFHQYLYGWHFALLTDHRPLLGLLSEVKAISSVAAAHRFKSGL